jgi:hypothetical protein
MDVLAVSLGSWSVLSSVGSHKVAYVRISASFCFQRLVTVLHLHTSSVICSSMLWQLLIEAMPNACTKGHRPLAWSIRSIFSFEEHHSPYVLPGNAKPQQYAATAAALDLCAHMF